MRRQIASISTTTARRSPSSTRGPRLSELREPRRDRARWWPSARRTAPWPRDPDGAPLYPGTAQRRCSRPSAGGASTAGEPYALRLDMAPALRARRRADLDRDRRRSERRERHRRGRPRSLGRRGAGAQGDADELSPRGRGGRCAAGRDPRGARAGPVLGDQRAPAAAGAARPAGAASTTTTA